MSECVNDCHFILVSATGDQVSNDGIEFNPE